MKTLISLDEFVRLTGLSDAALGRLLRNNELPCIVDQDGSLKISSSEATLDSLLKHILQADLHRLSEQRVHLKERLRSRLISLWDELEQEIAIAMRDSDHE